MQLNPSECFCLVILSTISVVYTGAEWKTTVMHGPQKKCAVLSYVANFKLLALHLKLHFLLIFLIILILWGTVNFKLRIPPSQGCVSL